MATPIFTVFADPNWPNLFLSATGIVTKLVSSIEYTVTDAEGGELVFSGIGLKTTNVFGYEVPSAGTITGFSMISNGVQIAFGTGFSVSAAAVDAAIENYLFGQKTALADLWFSIPVEISGTAAHIAANLAPLETYSTHIVAIKPTSGELTVTTADFTNYKVLLDKLIGAFAVSDTAAHVAAAFNALETDAAKINAIHFTNAGAPPLVLTAAQATADAALLPKIVGKYVLDVKALSGAWTTTGHGAAITIRDIKGVDRITGGAAGDTFVFSAGFGSATITDFYKYTTGATHDTLVLPVAEFASGLASLIKDASQSGANILITAGSDHLTLDNMTMAQLKALPATDFKFV